MKLTAGSRWKSAVCDTEVVIVRPPKDEGQLECGGSAMLAMSAARPPGAVPQPERSGGTLLGKRYADEARGLEVLCTKGGTGALAMVDDDLIGRVQGIEGVALMTRSAFLAAARETRASPEAQPPDPESVAVLLFTSGTTGEPKAAVLRHRHLTSYVISTVEFMGAGEDEAALVSVPPYHVAGISAVLTSVYAGRRIVYLPGFTPEAWVAAVRDEAVTQAMVVPTMLGRILDVLEREGARLELLRHPPYRGGPIAAPV